MTKPLTGTLYALEAEQAIVGALFGERSVDAFDRLSLTVRAEDFFVAAHGAVFSAFSQLVEEGNKAPDPATLSNKIKSLLTVTDEVKGLLTEAMAYPYHLENIEDYGNAVVEKARARKLGTGLQAIAARAGTVGGDISAADLLRETEAFVHGFGDDAQGHIQLLDSPSDALALTLAHIENVSDGKIVGVKTGIEEFDVRTGGMQNGELIIVGARPSMGKTAFALTSACNFAAMHAHLPKDEQPLIAVFSLEMPTVDIVRRMLAGIGRIDHDRLRKAQLTDDDYSRLGLAVGKYDHMNIRIDCDPKLTPSIMRSKLRLLRKRTGKKISFVIVDYLGLADADREFQNKATEVGEVSKSFKRIAKEEDVPVMCLSQLNRELEKRSDKRPVMSDLRDSGSVEQDADTIVFLYRDEYYNPDSDQKGMAEIIVAKARNGGQLGTIPASFVGEHVRFENSSFYKPNY